MNMSMNFSTSGLEQFIDNVMQSKESEIERKKIKFGEIISGIARKYTVDNFGVEYDDLYQDLWVRTLELINDCGGIENTDERLVARVCWNKAVDMYRYHRRRRDSKAEYIEGSDKDINMDDWHSMSAGQRDYFDSLKADKFGRGIDLVLFKEVIDLFEIGSKERKYVVLKLVNNGVIDMRDLDLWDRAIVGIPETDDEEGYIHMLGYKSHSPGSWTCKKRSIKATIYEFLKD